MEPKTLIQILAELADELGDTFTLGETKTWLETRENHDRIVAKLEEKSKNEKPE